jgi:hypothetical protein
MSLSPKILRDRKRIDLQVLPPGDFVARLMQLPVVTTAEWHRKFIADFQANATCLGKSKMMRIARLSTTDHTRLRCDKLQMRLVSQPLGLGNGELALVDPTPIRIKPAWDERRR